jgi:hypothetical protein
LNVVKGGRLAIETEIGKHVIWNSVDINTIHNYHIIHK